MERKNYTVAIDLGCSSVVVAVGEKTPAGEMSVVCLVSKPSEGVKAGQIENIELVSHSIREAVSEAEEQLGVRITEAYAGISGDFVRCARHTDHVFVYDPQNGVSQHDVDALFDRMRNVQAPDDETIMERVPQNYMVDDKQEVRNPVGSFGKKLSSTFNFILCQRTPMQRLDMALKRLGIKLLGVVPNALATPEALLSPDEKEEGVAVIDIGGGTTDVVVYQDNIIRHVGIVPMGGNVINKDIRSYGILEKHVESLKTRYGEAMRDAAQPDKYITTPGLSAKASKEISAQNLAAIIEARMLDIIDFAIEEIKKSGYHDKLGAGVVLTGGGAQLKHVDLLFKSYTGLDARVAGAESNLDESSLESAGSPALATAIGLLMKAYEDRAQNKTMSRSKPLSPRPATKEQPSNTGVKRNLNDFYQRRQNINDGIEEGGGDDGTEEAPVKNNKPEKKSAIKRFFNRLRDYLEEDEIEDNEI